MLLCLTLGAISPVLSILAGYDIFGGYSLFVSMTSILVYPGILSLYIYLTVFAILKWKTIHQRKYIRCIWEWLLVLICVLLCLVVGDVYWDTYQPALHRSSATDCF